MLGRVWGVRKSWNGYAYALNNPLVNVDPSGMTSGSPCEGNTSCESQIPGCMANPQACAQTYFAPDPIQGATSQFQLAQIHVAEYGWQWVDGTNPSVQYSPGTGPIACEFGCGGTVAAADAIISYGGTGGWALGSQAVDVPVGIDIWQGQQALWSNTAGVGNALTLATAAVVAAPVALSAEAPSLLGPSVGRVLWSGPGNMTAASMNASVSYGTTLGNTAVGWGISLLGSLGVKVYPLWGSASAAFANGAVGPVTTFVQGAAPESIFVTKELPIILSNGNPIVPH